MNNIKLKKNPRLIISRELKEQIDFLHRKVGKLEWSGILFFDVKGGISDPSKMQIAAKSLYLLDIGTQDYTEYNIGNSIVDAYEAIPGSEIQQFGHIHTHHGMSAFFSETDNSELEENAPNFNYYLSLIVNFSQEYSAKIAINTKIEKKMSIIDENHNPKIIETIEEEVVTFDCDIEFQKPPFNTTKMHQKIKALVNKKKKAAKVIYAGNHSMPGIGGDFYMNSSKPGKTSQMKTYQSNQFEHYGQASIDMGLQDTNDDITNEQLLNEFNISTEICEEILAASLSCNIENKEPLGEILETIFKSETPVHSAKAREVVLTALSLLSLEEDDTPPIFLLYEIFEDILDSNKAIATTHADKKFNDFIDTLKEIYE